MSKLLGAVTGLKSSQQAQIARLYRRRTPAGQLMSYELAEQLVAAAHEVQRPIAVLVSRQGHVTHVIVGEPRSITWPTIRKREATARLSGWRAIVAYPKGGGVGKPDLVALAMNRFDMLVVLDAPGPTLHGAEAYLAHLLAEPDAEGGVWRTEPPARLKEALAFDFETWLTDTEAAMAETAAGKVVDTGTERAILVSVQTPDVSDRIAAESLAELAHLASTAGAEVLARMPQKRAHPEPATYMGKGKVDEVALKSRELGANAVVVDTELSPSQQAKLEDAFGLKVIDRTALILDIFAQRAQTKEGKLQVELAQLKYLLPRLRGSGAAMSRLGGGIGTRGPGETKLETDRRRINTRIAHLEGQIEIIKQQRSLKRKSRQRRGAVQIALMGYTNAGKSTLLNRLTRSDVLAENKLFATLDPITRKLRLPGGHQVLLTDTVGFIQRLPTQLVAAFRATLEEVTDADILLQVVDASHPNVDQHVDAVAAILEELGAGDKPMFTALNKIDAVTDTAAFKALEARVPNPVGISALTGSGIMDLLALLESEARLAEPEGAVEPPPVYAPESAR